MTSRTDSASSHFRTMSSLQISDAEPGIGTTKSAFPAPTDGSSMTIKSVLQFLINVPLMMPQELVLLATKVMTLRMENVFSLTLIMPIHQI